MTTTVTIKANHGWPVRVERVNPDTEESIGEPYIVKAGDEFVTSVHSGSDLRIHEIQPNETVE